MHNVNVDAIEQTAARARSDASVVRMPLELQAEWQPDGGPQLRATIPYPGGEVEFAADFPAAMGGSGAAPSPLAYCFWGGLACYAMTFALEAAREGVELHALHAVVRAEVDQGRALGVSERPPVERIDWQLAVETDADDAALERLAARSDERCPGVYCIRNPIALETRVVRA